ncbi:hypothetical protein A0J57_03970 [Sphingobium sp. 22B]|uniref:aromatic ring-hydroxylating oxygenase subunit alpha n=1 Tax=unclassified Sphingobium TaxID=2611147 RepID=UPI000782BFD3|nr:MULTISPECIES: aromatic ring-hydroxylating dioxygenase subunit alpha [unclassified Sphingobium]KXU33806.1 hypothetical protein AXW74_00520 [Sphingobium sp. AM]KYC33751.1 hypothetical protein A0J57_03970 [Sphingobium sp. 22B]OAP33489.1 hypothetical protein A8O16_03190 [Sphingobium sp. 20006FA]
MNKPFDFRKGFSVDKDAKYGEKHPYIDNGTALIDPKRYYDPQEAEREWDKMWTKTWLMAGLASDCPNVGDVFKFDVGRASIIVVRTRPEELKAFHNFCAHRANTLVTTDFGTVGKCFHCSFHGWEYDLDGNLVKIRDEEIFRPDVIAHRPGLEEVKIGLWGNFVFINMDPDAEPLMDFLGDIPKHLEPYNLERFRPYRDEELTWDANWKTAAEAFLEFYHGDDVHPEVLGNSETYRMQYDLFPNGHGRMIIPVGLPREFNDGDKVPPETQQMLGLWDGKPEDYPELDLSSGDFKKALVDTKRRWAAKYGLDFSGLSDGQVTDDWNYSFFPNMTFNTFADVLQIQRWLPDATNPERSRYVTMTLAPPVDDPDYRIFDINNFGPDAHGPMNFDGKVRPPRERHEDTADFGYVLNQDIRLVPEVQKGIKSPGFKGALLGEAEVRIRHYLVEIDRYLER